MSGTGTSGVQHKLKGAEKRAEKHLRDPEAEKKFGMQVAAISAVVGGIPLAMLLNCGWSVSCAREAAEEGELEMDGASEEEGVAGYQFFLCMVFCAAASYVVRFGLNMAEEVLGDNIFMGLFPQFADHSKFTKTERIRVISVDVSVAVWSVFLATVLLTLMGKAQGFPEPTCGLFPRIPTELNAFRMIIAFFTFDDLALRKSGIITVMIFVLSLVIKEALAYACGRNYMMKIYIEDLWGREQQNANANKIGYFWNFLFLVYIGMTMSKTLVFFDDGLEVTDSISGHTMRVPKVCLSFVDSCDIMGCSSDEWATRPGEDANVKMPSCTVEGASPCCGLDENKTFCFGGNWSTVQCNLERDPALTGCENEAGQYAQVTYGDVQEYFSQQMTWLPPADVAEQVQLTNFCMDCGDRALLQTPWSENRECAKPLLTRDKACKTTYIMSQVIAPLALLFVDWFFVSPALYVILRMTKLKALPVTPLLFLQNNGDPVMVSDVFMKTGLGENYVTRGKGKWEYEAPSWVHMHCNPKGRRVQHALRKDEWEYPMPTVDLTFVLVNRRKEELKDMTVKYRFTRAAEKPDMVPPLFVKTGAQGPGEPFVPFADVMLEGQFTEELKEYVLPAGATAKMFTLSFTPGRKFIEDLMHHTQGEVDEAENRHGYQFWDLRVEIEDAGFDGDEDGDGVADNFVAANTFGTYSLIVPEKRWLSRPRNEASEFVEPGAEGWREPNPITKPPTKKERKAMEEARAEAKAEAKAKAEAEKEPEAAGDEDDPDYDPHFKPDLAAGTDVTNMTVAQTLAAAKVERAEAKAREAAMNAEILAEQQRLGDASDSAVGEAQSDTKRMLAEIDARRKQAQSELRADFKELQEQATHVMVHGRNHTINLDPTSKKSGGAHKPYDYSGDNWALNMEEECFNVQIKVHDEEAKQAVIDAAEAARKEAEKKAKKQGKAKDKAQKYANPLADDELGME